MNDTEEPRRTVYAWAEEMGMSASIAGAVAFLRGMDPGRCITRGEFEDQVEALYARRWG